MKYPDDYMNKVICGDCLEVMKDIPDKSVDLVLTDPPYNIAGNLNIIAKTTEGDKTYGKLKESEWDTGFEIENYLSEIGRIIKSDATVCIFTSQFLAGDIWKWMSGWAKFYNYLVWCKPNPMPSLSKRQWTWGTELICYATRGKHKFNSPESGHALNWIVVAKESHITEHPTEKPVSIMAKIMERNSDKGDIIFDGFLGSGTTAVTAKKLGRNFIGIEINPDYCKIAEDRLRQTELFTSEPEIKEEQSELSL